jgi:hypothetical protein
MLACGGSMRAAGCMRTEKWAGSATWSLGRAGLAAWEGGGRLLGRKGGLGAAGPRAQLARERGAARGGCGAREVGRPCGPREGEGGEARDGLRAGRARGERGGPRGEREGAGPLYFLFMYLFSFLSFFCFYSLRFNFKLEHILTNEKNSQQAKSSINSDSRLEGG